MPFPSPGDLPKTGVKPGPRNQVDSLPSEPPGKPLILLRGQIKKWGGKAKYLWGYRSHLIILIKAIWQSEEVENPLEKVEMGVRNEEINMENIKTLVKKFILRKDGGSALLSATVK